MKRRWRRAGPSPRGTGYRGWLPGCAGGGVRNQAPLAKHASGTDCQADMLKAGLAARVDPDATVTFGPGWSKVTAGWSVRIADAHAASCGPGVGRRLSSASRLAYDGSAFGCLAQTGRFGKRRQRLGGWVDPAPVAGRVPGSDQIGGVPQEAVAEGNRTKLANERVSDRNAPILAEELFAIPGQASAKPIRRAHQESRLPPERRAARSLHAGEVWKPHPKRGMGFRAEASRSKASDAAAPASWRGTAFPAAGDHSHDRQAPEAAWAGPSRR